MLVCTVGAQPHYVYGDYYSNHAYYAYEQPHPATYTPLPSWSYGQPRYSEVLYDHPPIHADLRSTFDRMSSTIESLTSLLHNLQEQQIRGSDNSEPELKTDVAVGEDADLPLDVTDVIMEARSLGDELVGKKEEKLMQCSDDVKTKADTESLKKYDSPAVEDEANRHQSLGHSLKESVEEKSSAESDGRHIGSKWSAYGDFPYTFERSAKLNSDNNQVTLLGAIVGLANYGARFDLVGMSVTGPVVIVIKKGDVSIVHDLSHHYWPCTSMSSKFFSATTEAAPQWNTAILPIIRRVTWHTFDPGGDIRGFTLRTR